METQDYSLQDGDRQVEFTGELIGSANSDKVGKQRWSEICIYRTTAGNYVVHGVGRSRIQGEVDKQWVQVCELPECVIEKLHMYDKNQSRYIPYTNRKALDEAKVHDRKLAEAFAVEHVD